MSNEYRQLTEAEISSLASRVARNSEWNSIVDYARSLFGPIARKVEIETGSEYNDEGGYSTTIDSIRVFDVDGVPLGPEDYDLTTPYWVGQLSNGVVLRDEAGEPTSIMKHGYDYSLEELADEARWEVPAPSMLDLYEFDLEAPPEGIEIPEVFVKVS